MTADSTPHEVYQEDYTPPPAPAELAPPAKPAVPIAAIAVGVMLSCGLFALLTSAFDAFLMATDNRLEALAKAMLIEGSLIAEALVIMRRGSGWRRIIAFVGACISVAVSSTYNYIQAQAFGQITEPWQLWGMAIGPVAAMVGLALVCGHLVNEFEVARELWNTWERGEAERKRVRAAANLQTTNESDKLLKWRSDDAREEREHKERLAEIEARKFLAQQTAQPAAPTAPPPVQAPLLLEVDQQARAIIDDMRAKGASKTATVRELLAKTLLSKKQIAGAVGVNASLVTVEARGIERPA